MAEKIGNFFCHFHFQKACEEEALGNSVGWGQGTGLNLAGEIVGLRFGISRNVLANWSIANTIDRDIEQRHLIGILAILGIVDSIIDSGINTFECAGDDTGVDIALIAIHANTEDTLLIGGI